MGGPGSGSWYRWDTRRVIDTVDCLDVRGLARQGALREGVHASVAWRRGAEHVLEWTCESWGIVLQYRARRAGGEWCSVHQEIAVERVRTGFGTRALLRCSECQRRVALVYLSDRLLWVCRVCMRLPYKSQCEMVEDRLYRRMMKIRARVGAGLKSMDQPVWHYPKPKHMHQRTYERIGTQAEEARGLWIQANTAKLAWHLERFAPAGEGVSWREGS